MCLLPLLLDTVAPGVEAPRAMLKDDTHNLTALTSRVGGEYVIGIGWSLEPSEVVLWLSLNYLR